MSFTHSICPALMRPSSDEGLIVCLTLIIAT